MCGVFVSVPRLDLHSKTLNTIAEMSCFMWVLRRISLIIAENVQFVNNSLCKRLIEGLYRFGMSVLFLFILNDGPDPFM